jgi:hypothetical protein
MLERLKREGRLIPASSDTTRRRRPVRRPGRRRIASDLQRERADRRL